MTLSNLDLAIDSFNNNYFYNRIHASLAQEPIKLNTNQVRIIKQYRKSVLLENEDAWLKEGTCDVTKVSFHNAENCEHIGIYLLHELSKIIAENHIGFYRDDGRIILVLLIDSWLAEKRSLHTLSQSYLLVSECTELDPGSPISNS